MNSQGMTLWLTGLSGVGKTTLARLLAAEFQKRSLLVEVLDGDVIRESLSKGLGFSKEDRNTNVRRIGFVSNLLSRNGVMVIVAAISPYQAARDAVRADHGSRFVEIFVDCPLDVLIQRDTKGLYKKALAGEVANLSGISDPYERPSSPEVIVHTDTKTAEQNVADILDWLEARGILLPSKLSEVES